MRDGFEPRRFHFSRRLSTRGAVASIISRPLDHPPAGRERPEPLSLGRTLVKRVYATHNPVIGYSSVDDNEIVVDFQPC